MARKVFYSFHYEKDITRAMIYFNQYICKGGTETYSGIIKGVEFEEIKREGQRAIERWIDNQLKGTSVTVVLIGEETLSRPYVQYEIRQSLNKGNAVIGVHIYNLKDFNGNTSRKGFEHTQIGYDRNDNPAFFDKVAYKIYDKDYNVVFSNLAGWVEEAAKSAGY